MLKVFGVSLVVLIFLSGCAAGVKHDYVQDSLDLKVVTGNSIVVGTLDHRSYILNYQKNDDFVGLSRGGFGNPFDVTTLSGNSLAGDISKSITSSLRKNGVNAQIIEFTSPQSVSEASEKLISKNTQRSLLLTLREWKGDSMINVGFTYDFDVSIFNQDGKLLLEKQMKGKEHLGSSDPFSPGGSDKMRDRFKSLMKALFHDPEVNRNLN